MKIAEVEDVGNHVERGKVASFNMMGGEHQRPVIGEAEASREVFLVQPYAEGIAVDGVSGLNLLVCRPTCQDGGIDLC